jgi:ribonuclease Z
VKKALAAVLAVAAVLLALAFVFRTQIALNLMQGAVQRNMQRSALDDLDDGLHVALCGSGSPLPDPDRSGPCVAVVAGSKLYLVDAGAGAARRLAQMRLPVGRVEAVLLTHFHSDHIDGLGELMLQRWVNSGRRQPLPVFGPPGVEEVVAGFGRAYAQDAKYRVAHHGEAVLPPGGAGGMAQPFELAGERRAVLERAGLTVSAFPVDHQPVEPAVGYRFDFAGRSLLVSGDTRRSASLAAAAAGVEVLVHEALAPQLVALLNQGAQAAGRANLAKITADIVDYHTTPVEAAEIAREAGARHLLLYHIVPPLPLPPLEEVFLEGVAEAWSGPVTLGRDGLLLSLPAGSQAIEVGDLL